MDAIPVGLYQTTLDGKVLYTNTACIKVARCPLSERDAWLSQDVRQSYVDPEEGIRFRKMLMQEGEVNDFVACFKCWDGNLRWLSNTAKLVLDDDGKPFAISGSFIDVTDRVLVEKKLREKSRQLNLALETAHLGYWCWHIASDRVSWYGDHAALFGIQDFEFDGTLAHVQRMVHPDDREKGVVNLKKTVEEKVPFDNTYRVIHPDGSIHWLNSFGHLTMDENGEPDHIFGITRDITDFKQAEEKLAQQNIALNVIMENRDAQQRQLVDAIIVNFQKLVFPYFEKLRVCRDRSSIEMFLDIIETNIRESLSPIQSRSPLVYQNLTPMEIQVADLIKIGRSSKEIADVLNVSLRTVYFYRNNIRKKLNIHNTKANLRSYLVGME